MIVEDFTLDAPKTKTFMGILDKLSLQDKKTIVVTADQDKNLYLSSRNIPKSQVVRASDLNTYDIVHTQALVLSEGAVQKINEAFK